jgi:MGT family glycosyltransferase
MSKILVAVTPLAGHVNPMLPVAESLSKRGHEVFFNTSDIFQVKVESYGLQFLPLLGNANYDYHQLGELIPELRTATSPTEQANYYIKRMFGDRIPDQYRGLLQIIDQHNIDLILTDIGFLGSLPLLLRDGPRPPVIACGVIAPMWHDAAFSPITGPDNTPEGRIRNLEHSRQADEALAPGNSHIDAILKQFGATLTPGYNANTKYHLPDLFLQLGVKDFEYPMYDRPKNLHFVGPILHKPETLNTPLWLEKLDACRPIVFVTQGTLANFDFDQLVNPALTGLADEAVQLVVTAGGADANTIVAPAHAIVEQYIPYELILPKTSVFITNGGYNGVQQALSYGVPVVSAGLSEDKGEVCARVNWSGAGIGLKTATPTPQQLRDAVRQVLREPNYRKRAQILGATIAKTDALKTIAHIVESTIAEGALKKTV